MSRQPRIRRQLLLREAEGYLELISALGGSKRPPLSIRAPLMDRALVILNELQQTPSIRAQVLFLKGRALSLAERYEEAVEALADSIELIPDDHHAYVALACCHKRLGRIDRAIRTMEEALEFARDEAILHYNLACYQSLAGKSKIAVLHLAQAFDLNPRYRGQVDDEPDFDPIRRDPDFQALTSVIV